MSERRLGLLQHWMKTVVTERGGLEEKLGAAALRHGLRAEDVVAEGRGLSARERLGVYAGGYVLRLLECMRADFPALRGFVGDAVFDAFAKAYVITRPPGSPSLYDLGSDFPRFLEETRPGGEGLDEDLRAMLDLPPELARLERARAEVSRAPGTEGEPARATPPSIFEVFGEVTGGGLTLHATPCLRLLELKFPLVDFLKRFDGGERPELPPARATFAALGRADYRVHVVEVEPWQFAFLKACEAPAPLYAAVRAAALGVGVEPSRVLAASALWLPTAFDLGLLRRVA